MRWRRWHLALVVPGVLAIAVQLVVDPLSELPWNLTGVASFAIGAVLARRVPANLISWLLLIQGSVSVVSYAVFAVAGEVALSETQYAWVEASFYSLSTSVVLLNPIILLRFPDGSHHAPRWRLVEWVAIIAAIVGGVAALLNGGWGGDVSQATTVSPLYQSTQPVGDVLSVLFYLLFLASFASSAVSLITRYRTSRGESRLQIKFLAFAAGYILIVLAIIFAESGFESVQTDTLWEAWLATLAFVSIPVAIGLAVLRYRLYDIDLVISRTLVLAVLAGFITLTYALIVVGVGQLVGGGSDNLVLAIGATALVAVAFEPVRVKAQRWANRLVYGQRATPYEVLADLSEQLAKADVGKSVIEQLAVLLRDGTGAEEAIVWLGDRHSMTIGATSPPVVERSDQPELDGQISFPVHHDGELVGALEVVKPRGSVLSTAERSLISDLAGSAGAVLGYQRLNDSLGAKAAELEQSRARLVGAQDLERRRLERELHEGAEQYIVALKVKLGVASQVAAKHGASELVGLLEGLTEEAQAALDDVQSLAKGIYPPILESDGLGAAVSALATASPVDIRCERDGIGRYPSDVEAAVYFDISEAVTNAVKHAQPPIRIGLSEAEGKLVFVVEDEGPGFDLDDLEKGSGLENMADRLAAVGGALTIDSTPGGRTRIEGEVPVRRLTPR